MQEFEKSVLRAMAKNPDHLEVVRGGSPVLVAEVIATQFGKARMSRSTLQNNTTGQAQNVRYTLLQTRTESITRGIVRMNCFYQQQTTLICWNTIKGIKVAVTVAEMWSQHVPAQGHFVGFCIA